MYPTPEHIKYEIKYFIDEYSPPVVNQNALSRLYGKLLYSNSIEAKKHHLRNHLKGFDLDIAIWELEHGSQVSYDRRMYVLDKRKEYNKIDHRTYLQCSFYIELLHDKITQENYTIAMLGIDLEQGKIDQNEYDKQVSTLKREPWVTCIASLDPKNPRNSGAFELDWNEFFIEELRKSGYYGKSEEELVNDWLQELCKVIATQEGSDDQIR
jgi:hypothetical protein